MLCEVDLLLGLAEGEGIFGHGKEKDWQMSMVMGYVVNVGMYFIKKILTLRYC